MAGRWIKWCTGEYRLDYCKQRARELRPEVAPRKVRVRKTCTEYVPGEGEVAFGRIWVEQEVPA